MVLIALGLGVAVHFHDSPKPLSPVVGITAPVEVPLHAVVRENGLLVIKGERQPFTGRLVENHPDGSRKLAIDVRDGKLEGFSRGWYVGGPMEVEETFVADHAEGLRTRWHLNGVKKSETHIVHGQLQGTYTEWHENGQQAVTMTLKDGKPDGVAEAWHPSGNLKSRTTMADGRIVTRQFFDDPAAVQAKTE